MRTSNSATVCSGSLRTASLGQNPKESELVGDVSGMMLSLAPLEFVGLGPNGGAGSSHSGRDSVLISLL